MASQDLKDLHQTVLQRFDKVYSENQEQRQYVTEQRRFIDVPGAQWEGSTNAGYQFDSGRFENYPRFELNKTGKSQAARMRRTTPSMVP